MLFLIEYYKRNPQTGEPGWDIELAWVHADNRAKAEALLAKNDLLFDEVITCSEASQKYPLALPPGEVAKEYRQ
jgi:hypothetical protein